MITPTNRFNIKKEPMMTKMTKKKHHWNYVNCLGCKSMPCLEAPKYIKLDQPEVVEVMKKAMMAFPTLSKF